MSQNAQQDISALMDGDLEGASVDGIIKSLKTESALKATWGRYHVVRSAMRREYTPCIGASLLTRVQAALESDPVYLAVAATKEKEIVIEPEEIIENLPIPKPRHKGWSSFGFATAAAVSVVAFIGLSMLAEPPGSAEKNVIAKSADQKAIESAVLQVDAVPEKIDPRFQAPPAPVVITQAGPVNSDQWRRLAIGDIPRLEHYLRQQQAIEPVADAQVILNSSAHVVSFGTDAAK